MATIIDGFKAGLDTFVEMSSLMARWNFHIHRQCILEYQLQEGQQQQRGGAPIMCFQGASGWPQEAGPDGFARRLLLRFILVMRVRNGSAMSRASICYGVIADRHGFSPLLVWIPGSIIQGGYPGWSDSAGLSVYSYGIPDSPPPRPAP